MTLIWIIVEVWLLGAAGYSFHCWSHKTDAGDAPGARRVKAFGYGLMWPVDLYARYKPGDAVGRPQSGAGPAGVANASAAASAIGARLAGRAQQVVAQATTSTRAAVEARADGAGPRLLELIRMEDDRPVTIERLVVLLVDAVGQDGDPRDLSDRDVYKAAKRRYRRLGAVSLPAGPIGGYLVTLYCEAATLCDLVELRGDDLAEEVVAAHLLVLWRAMPDATSAMAAIDGTGRSVVASLSRVAAQRTRTRVPAKMTKAGVITTLWDLRGVVSGAREHAGGGIRQTVFPGARVREFMAAATDELDSELTLHS